jgi:hypothetical protein
LKGIRVFRVSMPWSAIDALSVDFSENGRFGRNGIDFVQHGPIMGVTFRCRAAPPVLWGASSP